MPLALTVFGVAADGLAPTLCYALIRSVRGSGNYPEPNLPKDASIDNASRSAIPDIPLELIVWDKSIPVDHEVNFFYAIEEGRLTHLITHNSWRSVLRRKSFTVNDIAGGVVNSFGLSFTLAF